MIVSSHLVDRLEASAAAVAELLAYAIAECAPGTGADSTRFGRGVLIASGAGRYVNRAVGISLDEILDDDLTMIEAWYRQRQLPTMIEVSAWAPAATLAALSAHGYSPAWFRAMLACSLDAQRTTLTDSVAVIEVGTDEDAARWRAAFSAGFELTEPDAVAVSDEYARADRLVDGSRQFLAVVEGMVAGCASMTIVDGVAWLGAATTLPQYRRCGVQAAMVRHRLDCARDCGADIAAATAIPSGASARNLTRLGFELVEHQLVMNLPR